MKKLFVALLLLPILFIGQVSAVLTKTTAIDVVDAWQIITAATATVGNVEDVSGNYATILYIETALTENTPTAHGTGPLLIVEVSYADDEWVQLEYIRASQDVAAGSTLNGGVTAGDTTILVLSGTAGGLDVPGHKIFIQDGTIANSESVRVLSESGNTITLCQDLLRNHATGLNVRDNVTETIVTVPLSAAQVRVTVINDDGDCDFAYTCRVSKVTAL